MRARAYLESQGLVFCAENVRFKCGEIDLIMTDRQTLVFVEVRYRSSDAFGGAAGSVTWAKRRRLCRAAHLWLMRVGGPRPPCRFDLVLLKPAELQWVPSAFLAHGLL